MKKRNLNRFRREDNDIQSDFSYSFRTLRIHLKKNVTVTIVEGNLVYGRQEAD